MSIEFAEVSSGGGSFFKPAEVAEVDAFLIEVQRFEHQRPTNYGPKDTAVANLSLFRGFETEPEVVLGSQIQQTVLAKDLQPLVGKATIVKLEQGKSSKPGQNAPWVWRPVDADTKAKVVEYVKKREANLAEAAASAPSFD